MALHSSRIGVLVALLASACALPPHSAAPPLRVGDSAHGSVFHDSNANGVRDPGERGIAGVVVSDGAAVARTDAHGRWSLPLHDDATYFVVKPRDWAPPLDAQRLPRFFYHHKPQGSPALFYPGIPPSGPLPDSIDFPLMPRDEPEAFRMVVLGDPQPYSLEEVDYLTRDLLMELVGVEATFGVSLGDLVGDDLDLFAPLNRAIALVGIPWYNVLGNHDLNYDAPDDRSADDSFERIYGPSTYAFQIASVHFIALDDVRFLGKQRSADQPLIYEGGLDERTLAFVASYLETVPSDELVVLMMHVPLVGTPVHEVREDERRKLFEILASHPHSMSLSAHTHIQQNWYLGAEAGNAGPPHHHLNHATSAGSWWRGAPDEEGIPHATMRCGAPNGYSIIRFDGSHYSVRFKAARRPADHQMHVFAPDAVGADAGPGQEVLANIFAGSERSRVDMRVAGGPWQVMERVEREDPLYLASRARELRTERDWKPIPPPVVSPHLWRGELPEDLAPGTHLIEVRSVDAFGQTDWGRRSIRVEATSDEL